MVTGRPAQLAACQSAFSSCGLCNGPVMPKKKKTTVAFPKTSKKAVQSASQYIASMHMS